MNYEINKQWSIKSIEKERNETSNERWINHSICVGNAAGKIAEALNLNIDYAKNLGYIHDIGKKIMYNEKGVFPHAMKGYKYIKSLGYDEDYAGICIKHSAFKIISNKIIVSILRMFMSLLKTPFCTGIGHVCSSVY